MTNKLRPIAIKSMKVSGKELNHLVSRELYLFQEISSYIDEVQVSDEGQNPVRYHCVGAST